MKSIIFTNAAMALVQWDVKHPMQAIFNTSMSAYRIGKGL